MTEYVRPISLSLLNGTTDLAEVIGITRVHKKLSDYAPSVGVPGVKGARYYNEHIAKSKQVKFDAGDSVQWIYIEGVPEGMPETDIIAFHDIEEIEGFTPNWERMVDRLVVRKIKPIYGAMGWKTDGASGAVMPKAYW